MTGLDRLKSQLAALVTRVASQMDFHALYPSTVVTQSGQTLEVKPDSAKIPPLSGVPLRLGIPGAEADVAPGARVLLGFEAGDPSRPYCSLWEGTRPTRLALAADMVHIGSLNATSQVIQAAAFKVMMSDILGQLITAIGTAGGPPLPSLVGEFQNGIDLCVSDNVRVS